MPELPDLLYIQHYLDNGILGRMIVGAAVKQPVVLRTALNEPFAQALMKKMIRSVDLHGPFIRIGLSGSMDLILNLMLAGRLQHQKPTEKPEGYLCFSLALDDGSSLHLGDEQKMAKAYLVRTGDYSLIPKYNEQGIDILSPDFTPELFGSLAAGNSRRQVRVFINDHTALSSIGNAYADEILFAAKIHPKTFVHTLGPGDLERLYHSIHAVMEWGIKKVAEARQPINVKVREHLKVRNRKGKPCLECGTMIRREGVRGFDVFFCPTCQPATRRHFIDWNKQGGPIGENEER